VQEHKYYNTTNKMPSVMLPVFVSVYFMTPELLRLFIIVGDFF